MTRKQFLFQLLYIFLFIVGVMMLTLLWLRFYTNHGQELEMPDYIDVQLDEASKNAEDKTFQIVVTDSVHIVGTPGGEIRDQNPKGGSKVKENRKIYVTITKYNADRMKLSDLPTLYGRDFEQKRKELQHLNINANIKEFKYDSGEPNHILEVWYKGKIVANRDIERNDVEIEKGGTLDFVLSEQSGGAAAIVDVRCMTVGKARFFLKNTKFNLGEIEPASLAGDDSAIIVEQEPFFDPGRVIERGTKFKVKVSSERPPNCN